MSNGQLVTALDTGSFCEVLFSPDGNYLFTSPAVASCGKTHNWTKVHRLESTSTSDGGGFAFAFSPDSKWLVNSHSRLAISPCGMSPIANWLALCEIPTDTHRDVGLLQARWSTAEH